MKMHRKSITESKHRNKQMNSKTQGKGIESKQTRHTSRRKENIDIMSKTK
jgi:hypothetical protein